MKKIIFTSAVIIAFIALLCSCTNPPQNQDKGVKNISQNEFAEIVQKEHATIIDVRTPEEVAQGYIKGTNIFADIKGADFESKISKLDPEKTYIVYCRSGARSSSAATYMTEKGFKKVYNLEGGISSWKGDVVKP